MFSKGELALLKKVFAGNDELLYAVRNVLLQFPLSEQEQAMIKTEITPEVFALIKKRLYPEPNPDLPLTQQGDIYQTLTNDLKTKTVEEMAPLFDAKQLEVDYLDQQFARLKDIDAPEDIRFDALASLRDKSPYQRYVDTTARNFLLGYIDPMLNNLKVLAGTKDETPEQQQARLTRDSNK